MCYGGRVIVLEGRKQMTSLLGGAKQTTRLWVGGGGGTDTKIEHFNCI